MERAYCGSFMTSLEMAGLSVTILRLDDTIKRCLGMSYAFKIAFFLNFDTRTNASHLD